MNFIFLLAKPYLLSAGLLVFVYLLQSLIVRMGRIRSLEKLQILRFGLLCAVVLPFILEGLPKEKLFRPQVQVYSSKSHGDSLFVVAESKLNAESTTTQTFRLSTAFIQKIIWVLLIGIGLGICRLGIQYKHLHKLLSRCFHLKGLGKTRILVVEREIIPFSTRFLGRAYVVLPQSVTRDRKKMNLVLSHELQHHRQGDCGWVLPIELLKVLFFWCLPIYGIFRIMNELQEFACDEYLILERQISAPAYGRCLIEAVETAQNAGGGLAGTTGIIPLGSRLKLKRRILMLFEYQKTKNRSVFGLIGLGTAIILSTAAYAGNSLIQSRKLSLKEAEVYAMRASQGAEIPLNMNELVLARLNKYVGTQEGRKWFKEAIARKPQYEAMIERKINEYRLPKELIAIPLWESGFDNSAVSPVMKAAGIWQFIAKTARRYNLIVTPQLDERLNPEKETDAAMRYLTDLFNQFQDWRLVLKAYNEGEHRVKRLIKKYGTRDPWELERLDSTENYLSGAVAQMILMKHPELMD